MLVFLVGKTHRKMGVRMKKILILGVFILFSCQDPTTSESSSAVDRDSESDDDSYSITCTSTTNPTYNSDAKTIIDTYCVQCHASYSDYSGAAREADDIAEEVDAGTMPPGGGLAAQEIDTLIQWYACGKHQ